MVYLLHFERAYKHARHYLGFVNGAESLEQRLKRHRRGDGAKLVKAVVQAGIGFELARVWPDGDRHLERQLKNRKESPRLCPICSKCRKVVKP
ncbi:MAG: endonuclease [Bacillota bacterium]